VAFTRPLLALCLCVLLMSCLARRRVITRNGKNTVQKLMTADKQELARRVAAQYAAIQDLSATVDMVPALGSAEKSKITEYKDVRAYILFRKPADIRLIGLYPLVRNKAFDMVSNGATFRLYIPARNRFLTGKNEITADSPNKLENLRPQHFLEALLVRPLQPDEKPVVENLTDEDNAAYILELVRSQPDGELLLSRSVWFERLTLQMARQIIYDDAGNILTDARYSGWQLYDGVPFPKHIEINRPRDEYAVVITVLKMDIDKGVTADKFVLEQPEGTQLQVVGEKPAETPAPAPPAKPEPKKRKRDL
jgi:outer membrane lipoprotein-sorting protein